VDVFAKERDLRDRTTKSSLGDYGTMTEDGSWGVRRGVCDGVMGELEECGFLEEVIVHAQEALSYIDAMKSERRACLDHEECIRVFRL
jgi:hypothetical protein